MSKPAPSFAELLERVQAGDDAAMAELIAGYEPQIRRVIRMRLGAPLRRLVDTVDIAQSVHCDLATALREGRLELATEMDLVRYAVGMARKKILRHAAHWTRQQRDLGREVPLDERDTPEPEADDTTPSARLAVDELEATLERNGTPLEREVIGLRRQGLDNRQIADRIGKSPDAVRMILQRARQRL